MQEILQRIGEATTGTKDVVQNRLLKRVACTKMPDILQKRTSTRILSIDMGIKNLAYCIADVQLSTPIAGAAKMHVVAWRRLDLSEAFRAHGFHTKQQLVQNAAIEGMGDEDLYTPESLSWMAHFFLQKVLLDYRPDIVLIERQRWRSSGSPTIQQWTVRVNTLEAIMWAVLTTLKMKTLPETADRGWWWIFGVDPKRVGHFWLDGETQTPMKKSKTAHPEPDIQLVEDEEVEATKKLSRGKAEKKAKIQLLRTWLNSDNPSTVSPASSRKTRIETAPVRYPNISFSFSLHPPHSSTTGYGADATRQALLYATDKPSERVRRKEYYKAYVKKVDDITDCFLQAAAWVAWEENRRCLWPQVAELQKEVEDRLGHQITPALHLAESVKGLQNGEGKAVLDASTPTEKTKTSKARKMQAGEKEDKKTAKTKTDASKGSAKRTSSMKIKTKIEKAEEDHA
ncbi:hypothetical protein N0V90_008148 [Kalmusia sp. IMI 367209]|nr:hypothetical protein N0V90_008148 [Kalmusia sp. IMI 367209]